MTDINENAVDVAVTVEGDAVVIENDDRGVRDAADTVVVDVLVETAEVVNPFARSVVGKTPRNMSAHDRIFKAADILADEFFNLTGAEASVVVVRSAAMRGARVLFDIDVTVEGATVLGAARTGLTMEESLTFLSGASAMLAVVAALNADDGAAEETETDGEAVAA